MHDRQRGKIVFECDGCEETFESGTADWDRALEAIKDDGWRVKNHKGEWHHYCPACNKVQS